METPNKYVIEDNVDNSKTINSLIDDFAANTVLKGDAWEAVKRKLGLYSHALKQYSTFTDEFGKAVKEVLTDINNCINEYTGNIPLVAITDFNSELERIANRITEINSKIISLENELYTIESVPIPNTEDYKLIKVFHPEIETQIEELNKEKTDLTTYKSTVQTLYEKYEAAKKKLESAYLKMSIVETSINNINPSSVIM